MHQEDVSSLTVLGEESSDHGAVTAGGNVDLDNDRLRRPVRVVDAEPIPVARHGVFLGLIAECAPELFITGRIDRPIEIAARKPNILSAFAFESRLQILLQGGLCHPLCLCVMNYRQHKYLLGLLPNLPSGTNDDLDRLWKMTANQQIINADDRMNRSIKCAEIFVYGNRWRNRRTQCHPCLGGRAPAARENRDGDGMPIDQAAHIPAEVECGGELPGEIVEKDIQGRIDAVTGVSRITAPQRMT